MDLDHTRRIDPYVAARALVDDLVPQLEAESTKSGDQATIEAVDKAQLILRAAYELTQSRARALSPSTDMRSE